MVKFNTHSIMIISEFHRQLKNKFKYTDEI